MQKTRFKIRKMDCPSEEQMIRMKLSMNSKINFLEFDIPNRQLTVFHTDSKDQILKQLDNLNFDTSIIDSVFENNFTPKDVNINNEKKILWQVLAINFSFFAVELFYGIVSNSMGLVADSLDMLADSIVYGLALYAVGGSITRKMGIAKLAGYFQLLLAIYGFLEVLRRFISFEPVPEFKTMITISFFALLGNVICLFLLQKSKSKEAHMQASMIFTSNDIIINLGVIIAGGLVFLTNSKYPDLIVGTIVFIIVGIGSFKILKLSK